MSLLALQRDFQCWLTQEPAVLPESFDERHRSGLEVYLNNYRAQLLACLAASFPVVRSLIDVAAFDAAAASYIDAAPPRSWTLDAYAEGFPEALHRSFPQAPHIAELARLELALAGAFVGSDADAVDPARLSGIDWDTAILRFVPTLVLLPVTSNVGAIWSAIAAGEVPPAAMQFALPQILAIWRSRFESRFRVVSPDECAVIEKLRAGAPLGGICTDLVRVLGEERGIAAAGAMLGKWLVDEMIVEVSRPQA